jgi:hypothetical protein
MKSSIFHRHRVGVPEYADKRIEKALRILRFRLVLKGFDAVEYLRSPATTDAINSFQN